MELENLLKEWNCLDLLPTLNANLITFDRLRYLSAEDLKELIPLVGPRAEFREKLFNWKKNKNTSDEPTLPLNNSAATVDMEPISAPSINIGDLLEKTEKARSVKKYFQEHNFLLDNHRNEIIKIILEAVFEKDIRLSHYDFLKIADQIVATFPTERVEYYFIKRGKRKSAGGRLYDKFYNMKNKRRKLENTTLMDTSTDANVEDVKVEDFDWNFELKESLQRNPAESVFKESGSIFVSEKWKSTYPLRRIELDNTKATASFLNDWPAYKQPFGYKLIQYDFNTMYPRKEEALYKKWPEFKKLILNYYDANIKDRRSREEFASVRLISSKDSADYVILKLLNSVIVPLARYKNSEGRLIRKYTISDGEECFTLHLTSMDGFSTKYAEYKEKYFTENDTIQPNIVVIGKEKFELEEFYVQFDGILFKFPTYLECVNACFQIFQIFNLPYPKANQNVWMVIQKYFFEISNQYDITSTALAILLNYLFLQTGKSK